MIASFILTAAAIGWKFSPRIGETLWVSSGSPPTEAEETSETDG